jgi:DNA topoisomerase-3
MSLAGAPPTPRPLHPPTPAAASAPAPQNTVLCPYCYNHPPAFMEGVEVGGGGGAGAKAGMACSQCLHPTCRHSVRC